MKKNSCTFVTLAVLIGILACNVNFASTARISNLGGDVDESLGLDPFTAATLMQAINSDEFELQQLGPGPAARVPLTKGASGLMLETNAGARPMRKGRRGWRRSNPVPRPNTNANAFPFSPISRNTRADAKNIPLVVAVPPPPAVAVSAASSGPETSGPSRQWLELEVVPPPRISAQLHGEIILECEAVGSPPPLIYWLKNGVPLDTLASFDSEEMVNGLDTRDSLLERRSHGNFIPSSFAMSKIKSKLPLRCIRPEEEGVYTCVADNFVHKLQATTNVVIEEDDTKEWRPECEFRLPIPYTNYKKITRKGTQAYVHVAESLHMEAIGKDIILPCRGGGKPKPQISWTGADGQKITVGKKFQLNTKGDLIIKNLSWAEMGEYSCLVENQFGYEVASTFLYPLLNDAEESQSETKVEQQQR